ncbi:fibronectin type III domain-containing protein [Actinoplanes flavus]|uniref:Fibronectin type III domain-containing protein n=1 Tax=Actinoplanes flavus TaxID=2820290 RepID=A0ABS3UUY2_9ACTN|nr:fibronectin type III domain-containing protein [Actinoplanes flavus]MBO3742380.1 fibronectin type III domain-containing protein [Actinoplanes flavus]
MLGYRKSAVALSAVVLPLLIAGCSSSSSGKRNGEDEATSVGGTSWILVDQGQATPAPSTTPGTAAPTPSITLPPLPTVSPSASGSATPVCTPRQNAQPIDGLTVTPGSTSAVVTWYHPGGANIVDYRITAISQDLVSGPQPQIDWVREVPLECGMVSTTVPGLQAKSHYVFSVDAVLRQDDMAREGTYTRTVARSGVVTTT